MVSLIQIRVLVIRLLVKIPKIRPCWSLQKPVARLLHRGQRKFRRKLRFGRLDLHTGRNNCDALFSKRRTTKAIAFLREQLEEEERKIGSELCNIHRPQQKYFVLAEVFNFELLHLSLSLYNISILLIILHFNSCFCSFFAFSSLPGKVNTEYSVQRGQL